MLASRSLLPILAIGLAMAPVPAAAFFIGFSLPSPAIQANLDIPFFEESAAELVLRFNPGSDAVADPAIRDVVAAVMLLGIADEAIFPRTAGSTDLELSAPAFTGPIMEYHKALVDFAGPDASIEALAESSGMISGNDVPVLSGLDPAAMAGVGNGRAVLRQGFRRLTEAGYTLGSGARLLTQDGAPVELDISIAGPFLTLQQRNALRAATENMMRLGITVRMRENANPDTTTLLKESDAIIALQDSNLYESLLGWVLRLNWDNTPVDAFIEGLPKPLSFHQELTVFTLLDDYLTAMGYAVSLAHTTPIVDYSDSAERAVLWRTAETRAYLSRVCGEDWRGLFTGYTETELVFRRQDHPLVMYLPKQGGSGKDLRVALLATEEQVGIPDQGVVRVQSIDIPVERLGRTLVFKDPAAYLDFARRMNLEPPSDGVTTVPMLFQASIDGELRTQQPVRDDLISADALVDHELAGVPLCAAKIYDGDEALTFSRLASVE
ncbi:hypothetical protein [Halomonas sp. HL-93]|uniref:hypothetical protein n=1 Tax=Halomonas sp. HL-93 TaxID=1666906 RepID=UPI0007F0593A|nr:hypothetical protein [Halomonas sp. HL-93]SBR50222.1 hypothetical protein GA0071314_2573 [Halomonas sp. HL-93]